MELKIDEDYKKCLPELRADEYTELEKSIIKDGVLNPILVWDGYIIDGHNRYAICKAHHIDNFPVKDVKFSSKDEALEWILQNQLGRRNLTNFHRNRIVLKYEEVVAKRMKERQAEYYGNQYSKVDLRPNGQKSKNQPTTKRAELAKIAGTSQGSIQRTKLILEKGTPEQIERAERGGKGNSVSAIAKEIDMKQKGIETRTCRKCGRVLPVSEFYKDHSNECKKCRISCKTTYDIKGRPLKILPELQRMTAEEIIGDLYDTDKEIVYTDDDLKEELNAKIEDFKWSVQNCLQIHMDILKNEKSKDKVLRNLTLLQEEIQKWKELYDYE